MSLFNVSQLAEEQGGYKLHTYIILHVIKWLYTGHIEWIVFTSIYNYTYYCLDYI